MAFDKIQAKAIDTDSAPERGSVTDDDFVLIRNANTGEFERVKVSSLLSGTTGSIRLSGEADFTDPSTTLTSVVVNGDPDNATITQGVEPTDSSPIGVAYLAKVSSGGITTEISGISETVFNNDQILWSGTDWTVLSIGQTVTSVNGQTGAVTIDAISEVQADSKYAPKATSVDKTGDTMQGDLSFPNSVATKFGNWTVQEDGSDRLVFYYGNGLRGYLTEGGEWHSSQVFDTGGRVYSPDNKPTPQDINALSTSYTPSWNTITGKPSLFPTEWDQVSGKPNIFPTDWSSVQNKPDFTAQWSEIDGKPTVFPSTWNQITEKPDFATRWPTPNEAGAVPVETIDGNKVARLQTGDNRNTSVELLEADGNHGLIVGYNGESGSDYGYIAGRDNNTDREVATFPRQGQFVDVKTDLRERGQRVYSPNNKPSPSDIGAPDADDVYTKAESNSRFAPVSHNHDDLYYRKSESDSRYLAKTGTASDSQALEGRTYAQVVDAASQGKVPDSRTVNGKELSSDVTITKGDVGLSQVNNWSASSATNLDSTATYATSAAVKAAYDRATQALEQGGGLNVGPIQLAPYALYSTSNRFLGELGPTYSHRNDNGSGQLFQGLHALGSYMLVARDRSDTILTGCRRQNKSGYIQLRAYYRRVL